MDNARIQKKGNSGSALFLLLLHSACFLLVVVYVNMFQFWAWLSRALGNGVLARILPILITLAILLVIAYRFIERVNKGYQIKFVFLGLGIVTAFLALAIPEPAVPIKRIHVAEYILLSFVVRYVLSHRLQGVHLLLFTALVTSLYGVHDEMLQGLHSLRYYGWRDMTVNGVAGLSGAMLGHGLLSFGKPLIQGSLPEEKEIAAKQYILFACLFAAVIWQIGYLYDHRSGPESLFAVIPVVVCGAVIAAVNLFLPSGNRHHGLQILFWLSVSLPLYPLISIVTGREFL